MSGRRPLVIAHRGASADAPENTLEAFELACRQRADMIETDLHPTADEAIVLVHDRELAGQPVVETPLEALRSLDLGGGGPVATLDEALDAFGSRIAFNLELKFGSHPRFGSLVAGAVAAVRARGLLDRTLFSSFWDPALAELRRIEPEARIGLLVSRRHAERALERAHALGAESLHPEATVATFELVAEARADGLAVHVFTVDEASEMERYLRFGVSGLFTNHPARLREILDQPGSPPGGSFPSFARRTPAA